MTEGLMAGVFLFVLALFAGFEVITKVPPTLHTPLMSGANAISGITLIGALLAAGPGGTGALILPVRPDALIGRYDFREPDQHARLKNVMEPTGTH